jgi:hypothetical protein
VLAVQEIVTSAGQAGTGGVLSSMLMVCMHVVTFPHASPTVHVRVTTIGHVPLATSIYVTAVIPQASEVVPPFVAFSNSTSVDEADTEE